MTESSTALQPFVPANLNELDTLAVRLAKSGLLPKPLQGKPADVAVILLTGHEFGLTPMVALRSLHVIEGKPVLSADVMVALCRRSPVCRFFRKVESTDKRAVYETQREGDPAPTRGEWTLEDAQRAGLLGKQNWKQYPKDMLRARCKASLARDVYPEIVGGVYDPDELPRGRNGTAVIDTTSNVVDLPSINKPEAAPTAAPFPLEELADEIRSCRFEDQLDDLVPSIKLMPPADQEVLRPLWAEQRRMIRAGEVPDEPPALVPDAPRVWAVKQRCLGDDGYRWAGLIEAKSMADAVITAKIRWPGLESEHWAWEAHTYASLSSAERQMVEEVHTRRELEDEQRDHSKPTA